MSVNIQKPVKILSTDKTMYLHFLSSEFFFGSIDLHIFIVE